MAKKKKKTKRAPNKVVGGIELNLNAEALTEEVQAAVRHDDRIQVSDEEIKKAERSLKTYRARTIARDKEKQRKAKAKKLQENEALRKELLRRELARRHLIRFIQISNPDYKAGWAHHLICRRLERFLQQLRAGEGPRLMLALPPRFGKSKIASQEFPAWALGLYPDIEIISSSYGVSLPVGFSRKVRATLEDPRYQTIFPKTAVDPDNRNVEGWMTTEGGGFIPAGVGGGITGKGADLGIVDDPFKDAEEADSATMRDKVWDWWSSTFYTRLSPTSGVIVINTRWHDDDLSGRLIDQMKSGQVEVAEYREHLMSQNTPADQIDAMVKSLELEIDHWEVLSFPAVAEENEYVTGDDQIVYESGPETSLLRKKGAALHPERYPIERLRKIKRSLQPRHWSALYQQNPVPEEGMYFQKDMFRYEADSPDWRELPVLMAWDLAIGKKEVNDYTVGVAGCIDYQDRVHILDVVRARMDAFQIVEAILDMYKMYNTTTSSAVVGIERGQIQLAIGPQLEKRMDERKLYPAFDEELKPMTDKLARARPLQGRMQQGMVIFPSKQPWVETLQNEFLRFPGGIHDDIVDACAWLLRMTSRTTTPKPPKHKQLRSWRDKLKSIQVGKHGGGAMSA